LISGAQNDPHRLVRQISSGPVAMPLADDPGELAKIPSPSITLWIDSISYDDYE